MLTVVYVEDWLYKTFELADHCTQATDQNTQTFDTTNTGFTGFDNTV